MTDQKTVVSNALIAVGTAVATAAGMGSLGWVMGVFEKGTAAADKEQIRAVLTEVMQTTIDGETKTYSEALSVLSKNDTVILTEIGNLKTDVGDLEDAVLDLASD